MKLRDYQLELYEGAVDAWKHGARDVLAVAPTGAGKTVIFSHAIAQNKGPAIAIAHRQELLGQVSFSLAREGVYHQIMGQKSTVKAIIAAQMRELGQHFYNPTAACVVAGVNTLVRRADSLREWGKQITFRVHDEDHHRLKENIWGKAADLFPNAIGLGVTATPERADGKGLGRHVDGQIDTMIVGPTMRELIGRKYLTDYRVFCPPTDLQLDDIKRGSDGDFVRGQLATATKRSSVMGDVVAHYTKLANGKLGVTFAPDVETATIIANNYNAAGVPAEVVSAKTPDELRRNYQERFKRRELLQLVNVDLFGEGYDLPAIEVVSMARATQSYGLYVQQFGRALRLLDGKNWALIIDHVGNVTRHGLPDAPRQWTLDRRERRKSSRNDAEALRVCLNPECMAPFERVLTTCPFCGWVPVPTQRSAPEFVDGDLYELDPATLAAMRGEIEKIDRDPSAIKRGLQKSGAAYPAAKAAANRHAERQEAQGVLRDAIAWWAGFQRALGRSDAESYKRFYFTFGVDVMTAQTLGRPDAERLTTRIYESIGSFAA